MVRSEHEKDSAYQSVASAKLSDVLLDAQRDDEFARTRVLDVNLQAGTDLERNLISPLSAEVAMPPPTSPPRTSFLDG